MKSTLDSVVAQSETPARWIIVDDGSTDETAAILQSYAKQHAWIEVVTRTDRGHRAVGPGVIEAFDSGYRSVDSRGYEYICKLDLDLWLPPRYFETLMDRMEQDPDIATCSGKSYVVRRGGLVAENHGDDTSLGMTKFYRRAMFEAIGGFVHQVMWDGIDCHMCRMRGWKACSWDDPELRFTHLRPMGSSQTSIFAGRVRHGFGQYFMGTGFVYMVASAASRVFEPPVLLGSAAMIWGWISSAMRREPRYENPRFRAFLRRYHWRVLLRGKRAALAAAHAGKLL
jgi:glycosyltransferase involved in cell wall biosynthesis